MESPKNGVPRHGDRGQSEETRRSRPTRGHGRAEPPSREPGGAGPCRLPERSAPQSALPPPHQSEPRAAPGSFKTTSGNCLRVTGGNQRAARRSSRDRRTASVLVSCASSATSLAWPEQWEPRVLHHHPGRATGSGGTFSRPLKPAPQFSVQMCRIEKAHEEYPQDIMLSHTTLALLRDARFSSL